MVVPDLGLDAVTALRVATMLVFISAFAAIAVRLYRPGGGRAAEEEAIAAMRDALGNGDDDGERRRDRDGRRRRDEPTTTHGHRPEDGASTTGASPR